jgi:hypothetical protein
MKQNNDDYQVVPYPKMRRWMAVTFRSAQHKPMMHDLIDGAPAARFTQQLKDLIESVYGLGDSTVESEQAVVSVAPGTSKKSKSGSH